MVIDVLVPAEVASGHQGLWSEMCMFSWLDCKVGPRMSDVVVDLHREDAASGAVRDAGVPVHGTEHSLRSSERRWGPSAQNRT